MSTAAEKFAQLGVVPVVVLRTQKMQLLWQKL